MHNLVKFLYFCFLLSVVLCYDDDCFGNGEIKPMKCMLFNYACYSDLIKNPIINEPIESTTNSPEIRETTTPETVTMIYPSHNKNNTYYFNNESEIYTQPIDPDTNYRMSREVNISSWGTVFGYCLVGIIYLLLVFTIFFCVKMLYFNQQRNRIEGCHYDSIESDEDFPHISSIPTE